jgi:hypothetical protein
MKSFSKPGIRVITRIEDPTNHGVLTFTYPTATSFTNVMTEGFVKLFDDGGVNIAEVNICDVVTVESIHTRTA